MAFIQTEDEFAMIYEVKNLIFKYGAGSRRILDEVSLSLDKGQILTILGPNGAGKTTLLNCMAGLLTPESGKILINGEDMNQLNKRDIARIVGYVPQNHTPSFNYKVIDFVMMGSAPRIGMFGRPGKDEVELSLKVLDDLGISNLADRSYMEISGGERQQAMIARAIVQQPEVIMFDEPTAHLDYGNQHKVLKMVRNMADKGYSIIITTHNPDHALLLGDKVAIVERNGKMISGDCTEIITEEKLRQVYDVNLCLLPIDQLKRTACFVPEL